MKLFVGLFFFCVSYLTQVCSQYYGCCSSHYYTFPGACCSHPCCVQSMVPVTCCGSKEIMKIRLTLKTYEQWKPDYADPNTDAYKAFSNRFIAAVKKAYANSKSRDVDIRISSLTQGSVVVRFVLAFKWIDRDPLRCLRVAIGTGWVPKPDEDVKVRVYPMSMAVLDKVLHVPPPVNLDCKPIIKQQSDEEMENEIFDYLNRVRPIHTSPVLTRKAVANTRAKAWSVALAKMKKILHSSQNEKTQSEDLYIGCVKEGYYLTGRAVAEKWYESVKVYFDNNVPLAKKLKDCSSFMKLIYKAVKYVDVGVSHFDKPDKSKCFVAAAFFYPVAATKTPKQLVANIHRGTYKGSRKRDDIALPDPTVMHEKIL